MTLCARKGVRGNSMSIQTIFQACIIGGGGGWFRATQKNPGYAPAARLPATSLTRNSFLNWGTSNAVGQVYIIVNIGRTY